MRLEPLGESFVILRDLPCSAPSAAARLQGLAGVVEAYAAFDTVGVQTDRPLGMGDLLSRLELPEPVSANRTHSIPVLYDGEDLPEVADRIGQPIEQIIALHAREYECRAVGFCPGFAYLSPLASPLSAIPRRDGPRSRVAPGSVAMAAGMTAVYPLERPGGWWLIGRTPLVLVDEADDYFPIQAGDRVGFVAIGPEEFEARRGQRLDQLPSTMRQGHHD